MFIDDDASVAEVNLHELSTILMSGYNLISLKRWDISYNKNSKPSIYNFPKYFIEWNFVVEREIFLESGGFHDIGVGSSHRAQSGEVFILIGKLILQFNSRLCHVGSTMIEHPSLDVDLRTEKAKGYLFGLGYSIGNILQYMTIMQKIYWINRLIISFIKRLIQECFFSNKSKPLNYNSIQIVVGFLSGITEAQNA